MEYLSYVNGNYKVAINPNTGAKIRWIKTIENDDSGKIIYNPKFPESVDMTITYKCNGGCKFCYAGCSNKGKHCNFFDKKYEKLLDSFQKYTEIAINGNDMTHPDLFAFLDMMKRKNVFVNLTVNQKHFDSELLWLNSLLDNDYIKGLGVSVNNITEAFCRRISLFEKSFSNPIVLHVIAGIFNQEQYEKLIKYTNGHVKLLILGYKYKGRGEKFFDQNNKEIIKNIFWLKKNINNVYNQIDTVVFDNNAISQLDIAKTIDQENYEKVYMGDEGQYTFFIDLVKGVFAKSSSEMDKKKFYKIKENMSIEDMFKIIKEEDNRVL